MGLKMYIENMHTDINYLVSNATDYNCLPKHKLGNVLFRKNEVARHCGGFQFKVAGS